jgi:hypothetical protein
MTGLTPRLEQGLRPLLDWLGERGRHVPVLGFEAGRST